MRMPVGAIFDGLRDAEIDDHERLDRGFRMCDALFTFSRTSGQLVARRLG
ncbi:MAG: hypothetical protein ABI455_02615 [Candidatus Dormiibacterota bacterium]